jgi:hypothetical protein
MTALLLLALTLTRLVDAAGPPARTCGLPKAAAFYDERRRAGITFSSDVSLVYWLTPDGRVLKGEIDRLQVTRGRFTLTSSSPKLTIVARGDLNIGRISASAVERTGSAPAASARTARVSDPGRRTHSLVVQHGQVQWKDCPPGQPATTAPDPARADLYNCDYFRTQADAQAFLRRYPKDPSRLDRDRNGIACEANPPPFDRALVRRT